jgi:hypothetical protein
MGFRIWQQQQSNAVGLEEIRAVIQHNTPRTAKDTVGEISMCDVGGVGTDMDGMTTASG